jgi:hypothetical protein
VPPTKVEEKEEQKSVLSTKAHQMLMIEFERVKLGGLEKKNEGKAVG